MAADLPPLEGPNPTRQRVLRWLGGELDVQRAEVRRDGEVLALDRSSYEVLLALLSKAGQVLSKDDLLEAGWPGRVVSENSLAKAISRLRKELGEAASAPLQSVHGYGYRWTGEVRWVAVEDEATAAEAEFPSVAVGQGVPGRPGWTLRRLLPSGSSALAFLAESDLGLPPRALKFAASDEGTFEIRHEAAVHRYLMALGRPIEGIVPALGWQLEEAPAFIEYPYFEEGDLVSWLARHGGPALPLALRLEIVAQLAETLGELHAAGVVHHNLQPANAFIAVAPERSCGWRVRMSNLGGARAAGLLLREGGMEEPASLPSMLLHRHAHAGEALYRAPELLAGGAPSQLSDAFSLGVLLYQMIVGDLRRPLAPGWENDIADALLREDIRSLAALRPEERQLSPAQLAQHLRRLPERRAAHDAERRAVAGRLAMESQLARQALRSRMWSIAAAALFVGLAIASWTGWLAYEARQDEAARRIEAQTVLAFLTDDMLGRADPYQGGARDISLRGALDAAAGRIDATLGGAPATAAAVHDAVARAYAGWGDYAKAADHRRQALAAWTRAEQPTSDLAGLQRGLCDLERQAGRLSAAQAACEEAALLDRRAFGTPTLATELAQAKLEFERGRCSEVSGRLQTLLDGAEGLDPALETDLHWTIGLCQFQRGEEIAAMQSFQALLRGLDGRPGTPPATLARALGDSIDTLAQSGRLAEAEALLMRLDEEVVDGLGEGHPDAVRVVFLRGRLAAGLGLQEEAASRYAEAHAGWSQALGPQHPLSVLAGSEHALALARTGDRRAAAALLAREKLEAAAVVEGRGPQSAELHRLWAETLLLLGRREDAAQDVAAFDRIASGLYPVDHPRRAMGRCLSSWWASLDGDFDRAGVELAACRIGLASLGPEDARRRLLSDAESAIGATGSMGR